MNPIFLNGKWHIEVETQEFGKVLLLEMDRNLPIPMSFDSETEALKYIDSNGRG